MNMALLYDTVCAVLYHTVYYTCLHTDSVTKIFPNFTDFLDSNVAFHGSLHSYWSFICYIPPPMISGFIITEKAPLFTGILQYSDDQR